MSGYRSGVAWCIVSAGLFRGELRVHGIRICRDEAEADQLLADGYDSGDSSYAGEFKQLIWLEVHPQESSR